MHTEQLYSNQVSQEKFWGQLTDVETASVVQWLFQQPELNLTAANDAGEWDNTM